MRYKSTRGGDKKSFDEIIYAGLAPDGGLYEPLSWPSRSSLRKLLARDAPFAAVVGEVLRLFAAPSFKDIDFNDISHQALRGFNSSAVIPLHEVEKNLWLLELFHGPTLSFKDIPLQVYARLLERVAKRGKRLLIMIGATSGDTGSAAIEALQHVRGLRLFMLHPRGRISDLQRKQMTCNKAPHICNIAVDGSYDDCLRLAKAMFSSANIQARGALGAVNSFNWVRIAVQSAVYLYAANRLPRKTKGVRFALASGNFGNAYAGYVAKKLGAPIESITLAVSRNDFLYKFFTRGSSKTDDVIPSLTPSIDIMTPNNLERLLFRILGGSTRRWRKLQKRIAESGLTTLSKFSMRKQAFKLFHSSRFDDEQILDAIGQSYRSVGVPLDPHSAIALAAAKQVRDLDSESKSNKDIAMITFATASAAKFPDTIERAIGARPHIPSMLAEMNEQQETYESIPADEVKLEQLIIARLRTPIDSDEGLGAEQDELAREGHDDTAKEDNLVPIATPSASIDDAQDVGLALVEEKEEVATANDGKVVEETTKEAKDEGKSIESATVDLPPVPDHTPLSHASSLSAVPVDDGELASKIAKLKEQTARLDEILDSSPTSMLTSSGMATTLPSEPPLPVAEVSDWQRSTLSGEKSTPPNQPSMEASESSYKLEDWVQNKEEGGQEKKSAEAQTAPSFISNADESDAEHKIENTASELQIDNRDLTESHPQARLDSNEIENLAQAAEEGQASLEEKIAKMKEQSTLLDATTEQTRQTLDREGMHAGAEAFSNYEQTTSANGVASAHKPMTQEATIQAGGENEKKEQEEQAVSGISGASPFFASSPSPIPVRDTALSDKVPDNLISKEEANEDKT